MAKAIDKYMENVQEIGTMLLDLMNRNDNHYDTDPDDVNWGHVGNTEHIKNQLAEIINFTQ